MLMQATFSRCGESIPMRVNRFDYVFQANKHGDMVCNVSSDEHIKILKHMGTFQEYDPPEIKEPVSIFDSSDVKTGKIARKKKE